MKPLKPRLKKVSRSNRQPEVIVENELILMWCFKALEGRATTMLKIADVTGIKLNTLRGCYRRLKEKGFIENRSCLKNIHGQVGIEPKLTNRPFILRGDMESVREKIRHMSFDDLPILNDRTTHQLFDLDSDGCEPSSLTATQTGLDMQPEADRADDISLLDCLSQEALIHNNSNLESDVKNMASELVTLRALLKEKNSECRNLEKALKETEQQLNLVLSGASLGMWDWNIKTGEMVVNDQWARMLGYSKDNIKPDVESWKMLVHPEDQPHVFEKLKENLEKGRSSGEVEYTTEHRLKTGDNDYKWVLDFSKIVDWDKDGKPLRMRGTHLDITQIKKLQNQLLRSEKLATAGKLAASITREVNSPLQAVAITLHTMKSKYRNDSALREYIDLIREAFEIIRRTMGYLSDVTRTGYDNKELVNVNELLEESLFLVRSSLKKNEIKTAVTLDSGLPQTFVSRKGLSQVFLNHINSAVEALTCVPVSREHEGGDGERQIMISTAQENGRIVIRISDTGPNIPETEFDHIFDPFYTRNKTMGIGIGLATCLEVVENNQGTITVENPVGGGVVFTITLPVIMENNEREGARQ